MTEDLPVSTLELDAVTEGSSVFSVDVESRIIRGRAVPFGVVGKKAGRKFQFDKGAISWTDPKRVKGYLHHDPTTAVAHATELVEVDGGLDFAVKVAKGPEGDRLLALADPDGDAVLDGVSIGGDPDGVRYRLVDGVHHAVEFPLLEITFTPQPVFADARVSSVTMSKTTATPNLERHTMTDTTATAPAVDETATVADFSTLATGLTAAIADGFANITFPQREVVDPTTAENSFSVVHEPSPYRFDGIAGKESFSNDLRFYNSDSEAKQRIDTFMVEAWEGQFAVTSANVSSMNPTKNRPDLFVPNLTFTRPLWDLISTGVVDDKTPFTIPKFASASGLVGAHTEGVEPTPGAFTATAQTVTPTPMSGKVEIVREVWDQGGEPKADGIIWGEMLNGYFEAIEARIATTLGAIATAEINLASATGSALVNSLTGTLVDLQFVRGGNRFTGLALDGMLGKALVQATDGAQRPLLPVIGATNSQGTTGAGFDGVAIGNLAGKFAWALGSSNASKSYLFVPSSVWAWASAPKKFEFEYRVAAVDLAIWGYSASAVTRDSDVKPIDYTTADA
jgi:phage head maturation protease